MTQGFAVVKTFVSMSLLSEILFSITYSKDLVFTNKSIGTSDFIHLYVPIQYDTTPR